MRTWPALAAIIVALAAVVAGVIPADASAPGSITGTVRAAASGAPVAGARVEAFKPFTTHADAIATTGADGTYRISGLGAGEYIVCVDATVGSLSDPRHIGYQSRCYRDAPWVPETFVPPSSNDHVVVSGGAETGGIDLALPPAAALTGRTLDGDGGPVAGVSVYVFSNPPPSNGHVLGVATTATHGTYRVTALPPSQAGYIVCFQTFGADSASRAGYLPQCYRNRPWDGSDLLPTRTKPVPARAGVITRGISAVLRPSAGLKGRVVDDRDGAPIKGVRVYVLARDGHTLATGYTSATGQYSIAGLQPSDGGERICFAPYGSYPTSATGHGGQCYDGVPWAVGATVPRGVTRVPLPAGSFATAGARLGPGGEIAGTIRDASGVALYASASIFSPDGQFLDAIVTSASGYYRLRNLTPGKAYIVCANDGVDAAQCFDHKVWNAGNPPPAGSARIVLAPEQVRRIPFVLADA